MKRFFQLVLLMAGLGWLAEPCQAQTPDGFVRAMFADLDKSQISSGILLQQSPVYRSPMRYDGLPADDSLALNLEQFGMLYGQFQGAATGVSFLPEPKVYLDPALRPHHPGDTVSLALLFARYDYIRKGAMDQGLFTWSNGHLQDVLGRSQSPYAQDTCFAFVALKQQPLEQQTTFIPPGSLIFNNLGWGIQDVEIDFGDGNGFRAVHAGVAVTVNYPVEGKKTIILRFAKSGQTYHAKTSVTIESTLVGERDYSDKPDEVKTIWGCKLNFFYACEDKKLRRPLIVAEGFGGDMVNYDKMFRLLGEQSKINGQTLKEWFNLREYDLIWVDWTDAGASIAANAGSLNAAITYINEQKHANGSYEPNILIGASMGGLCAKYALLQMHNVQGKDSEVSKFFSYDTPFRGSNVPIGVQAFVRDLVKLAGSAGANSAAIAQALQLLDSESAKNMIIKRVEIHSFPNTWNYYMTVSDAEYNLFQAELAALEQPRPLSAITRHIALSNGADAGRLQENMLQILLKFHLRLDKVPEQNAWEIFYDIVTDAEAFTAVAGRTRIYERTTEAHTINGDDVLFTSVFDLSAPLILDDAPGGTSNLGLDLLKTKIEEFVDGMEHVDEFSLNIFLKSFCFVPTISSLNTPPGTNITTSTPTAGSIASRCTASVATTGESISGLPEFNQVHFSMNTRIALVIIDELEPPATAVLPGTLSDGTIYNFGQASSVNVTALAPPSTPNHISQNLNIFSSGELWVNRNSRIAYVNNSNNPLNHLPQHFTVLVPGVTCEGEESVTITVASGGKIHLGDYNGAKNTGQVCMSKQSKILVNGGGSVIVDTKSSILLDESSVMELSSGGYTELRDGAEIWVKNGSTFHIHSGGTLKLLGSSMLRIDPGAQLILDAGAIVNLEALTSHIRIEGTLLVNGNFTFQGRGHFDFWNDHGLLLGPQANAFRVHALPINTRSIRLSNNTRLHIPVGKGIDLDRGGVEYTQDNMLLLGQGSWAEARNARFLGTNENAVGFSGENPGRLIIEDCSFSGVDAPIDISGSNNFNTDLTSVKRTSFERYENGSRIALRNRVLFDHCTLLGAGFGAYYGVFSDRNKVFILRQSDISDHNGSFTFDPDGLFMAQDARTGAKVNGGLVFWMDGGTIHNCDIGISNHEIDGTPTNVWLNHFATISNCQGGIVMDGDASKGLVMMDCARLLNNDWGILGEDIRLMIDPTVIAKQNGTPVSPNTFTLAHSSSGINEFFHICYRQFPSPGQPIPARMNYWGKSWDGTQHPTPLSDIALTRSPVGALPCTAPVDMDVSGAITRPPSGCDIEEFCDPNANCVDDCATLLLLMGGLPTVKSRFMDGYDNLKAEQFDEGRDDFGDVAGLWQPDLTDDGLDEYCQSLIHASRSLSEGGWAGQPRSQPQRVAVSGSMARVQPNPATGTFTVTLPLTSCTLRVWDTFGCMVYEQASVSGPTAVDASGWAAGVYWVEVIGDHLQQQAKVVVQR